MYKHSTQDLPLLADAGAAASARLGEILGVGFYPYLGQRHGAVVVVLTCCTYPIRGSANQQKTVKIDRILI